MKEILEYEVELIVTNPTTGARRSVTRREHAYSLVDAMMQANIVVSVESGASDIKLIRVGPPQDAVVKAMSSAQDAADGVRALIEATAASVGLKFPAGQSPEPTPPRSHRFKGGREVPST